MIFIICAWIYWFLVTLSIGTGSLNLLSRFTGSADVNNYNTFYRFWFGFAIVIGLLEFISLFLPMAGIAFYTLLILALLLPLLRFRSTLNKLMTVTKSLLTVKGLFTLLGIFALLIFVSYSANKEVTHTDTFIYHYNAVKWAKEYAAVPGLVNLHGRLGFNSSFFLFAAVTEVGVYVNHSAHIALSFLMAVCLINWCVVIANRREIMAKRIFCMLTFAYLVVHIGLKMDIASLSTDYPMAVIMLVFCLVLLDKAQHKMLLLLPLAALAFTFKLSGMPMIAIAIVAVAGQLWFARYGAAPATRKPQVRLMYTSAAVLCVVAGGFVIRNIITSGWLIYPFPIGNLHLPWSSPEPYVKTMLDWIKSFPKIPGGASPETIEHNSFFYWFNQWFSRFSQSSEFLMLFAAVPLLIWSALQTRSFSRLVYGKLNIILLISFAIISIIFWFMSAPDVRFGSVYFFILFAAVVVFLYEGSEYKNVLKVLIYGGFIYQLVHHTPAYMIDRPPTIFSFAYTPQPKLTKVIASPPGEKPELFIYMPAEGNQCGNSPIPCTPYAGGLLHSHLQIRQRVPGDISKGFLPPK